MSSAPPIPLPRYGVAALSDLVPTLVRAVAAGAGLRPNAADDPPLARLAPAGTAIDLEPASAVCLLVIDGLGWELLREHAAAAPFLSGLAGRPLTAGFPSTTAASLASLGTGRPPGEHGLVGYTMLLPGEATPLNNLSWGVYGVSATGGPGGDLTGRLVPEQVQPEATAFELAAAAGITVTLVGPRQHAASGMTRAVLRGGRYRAAFSLADLVATVAATLAEGGPQLVYAYHPDLDLVGHIRGVDSEAWRLQLAGIDHGAAALAERLPAGALLAITGDHGMVDVAPADRLDVADAPELLEASAPWAARRGRGMCTPRRARRRTCWQPGAPCWATACGWCRATRPSPRAGSAPASPTVSGPALARWWPRPTGASG